MVNSRLAEIERWSWAFIHDGFGNESCVSRATFLSLLLLGGMDCVMT